MIYIRKSENADSRTATSVDKEIFKRDTVSHIQDVKDGMLYFAEELMKAGDLHDHTKLSGFEQFYKDFVIGTKTGPGGAAFKELPWWKTHLKERHHLNDRVPDDVNLVDVIEMITDGVMAGMGRSGSVYPIIISDEVLRLAVKNTQSMLQNNVTVTEREGKMKTNKKKRFKVTYKLRVEKTKGSTDGGPMDQYALIDIEQIVKAHTFAEARNMVRNVSGYEVTNIKIEETTETKLGNAWLKVKNWFGGFKHE